jgi:hypothetical protein
MGFLKLGVRYCKNDRRLCLASGDQSLFGSKSCTVLVNEGSSRLRQNIGSNVGRRPGPSATTPVSNFAIRVALQCADPIRPTIQP